MSSAALAQSGSITGNRPRKQGSLSRNRRIALILRILLAIVMLFWTFLPIVWIISASFNASNSLVGQKLIPANPTLEHYRYLFTNTQHPYPSWYWNSLMLAVLTTVIGLVITTAAAYAFSRFRFIGRRNLLQSILLIQVFPNFLNMIAIFTILLQIGSASWGPFDFSWLGLNTHAGLLLVYLGGTLGANTWLTKGYFDSVPRDLDEAAMMDGASPVQIFTRILVPLVQPILVVVGLLSFIGVFSEYVLARLLLTDKFQYTLAVGLNLFIRNQFANRWGVFCAGALLAALPVVIIFMIFQRYLVGGLTAGGVKG